MSQRIVHADNLAFLRTLPDDSVSAIVTDPPYGLGKPPPIRKLLRAWLADEDHDHLAGSGGFMGKSWDAIVPHPRIWEECYRVLKPGGHLITFAGQRTAHLMGTAVEIGGFTIRDLGAWAYWSGFPKSLDVSKAIDKREDWSVLETIHKSIKGRREQMGLSLKEVGSRSMVASGGRFGAWYHRGGHMFFETGRALPGEEECANLLKVLGSIPELEALFVPADREVVGTHGAAPGLPGLRFGEGGDITTPATPDAIRWDGWGTALKPCLEPWILARKPFSGTVAANVLEHGTGALHIDACRYPYGDPAWPGPSRLGHWTHKRDIGDGQIYGTGGRVEGSDGAGFDDRGRWPANVYYCPKASTAEREAGLEGFDPRQRDESRDPDAPGANNPRNRGGQGRKCTHPTVKPIALMRWLLRLVTPPGGLVIDPYVGSGTTAIAAALEGIECIGIEQSPEYVAIARARLAHWQRCGENSIPRVPPPDPRQAGLFG